VGRISQVVFTPPPGPQYGLTWAASVGYEAPASQLALQCDSLSVTRGHSISCSVLRSSGQAMQSWEFIPSDTLVGSNPIQRTPANATLPWQGTMVSSGKMVVRDVNGNADSATIQVTRRTWDSTRLPVVHKVDLHDGIVKDRNGIPLFDPPSDSVLGQGSNWITLPIPITPSSWWALVGTGPNTGLSYSTSAPGRIEIETSVNEKALKDSSDFWKLQPPDPAPAPFCGRQWVVNHLALTRLHEGEGLNPHAQSHPSTTKKGYVDYYLKEVESFIRRGYPSTFDVRGLTQRGQSNATIVTNALTHAPDSTLNPWYHTCVAKVSN
jgi:hypothetical protein